MVDVEESEILEPHPVRGYLTRRAYNSMVCKHLEGNTIAAGLRRTLRASGSVAVTAAEVCEMLPDHVNVPTTLSADAISSRLAAMSWMSWTGIRSLRPGQYVYQAPQMLAEGE